MNQVICLTLTLARVNQCFPVSYQVPSSFSQGFKPIKLVSKMADNLFQNITKKELEKQSGELKAGVILQTRKLNLFPSND